MNKHLVEFIENNINELVFLLTPGGLISGKLNDLDKNAHSIGIKQAFHHAGSVKLSLGDISINADDVSAWGWDEPTLAED